MRLVLCLLVAASLLACNLAEATTNQILDDQGQLQNARYSLSSPQVKTNHDRGIDGASFPTQPIPKLPRDGLNPILSSIMNDNVNGTFIYDLCPAGFVTSHDLKNSRNIAMSNSNCVMPCRFVQIYSVFQFIFNAYLS